MDFKNKILTQSPDNRFLISEDLSSTENSSDELDSEKMSKLRFTFTCQVVRKFD